MNKKTALLMLLIILCPLISFSQNYNETLTITTYYPSPEGAFRDLEVRSKLVVGDISNSNISGINSIDDLSDGQIYVGDTINLYNQSIAPPASPTAGQIFYNHSTRTLEFRNDTRWKKIGE